MLTKKRGFTLIEVLVAITIMAIIMLAALSVYDKSQKAYILGSQMSDEQQTVRIAFQKLSADLRLTGWNFNPDGDQDRADEQVEGIWQRAIVFRADFDGERENTAPNDLETGTWGVVSTGNDEIVGYVLRSDAPGASNGDSITFQADVVGSTTVARDAVDGTPPTNQETVNVSGIDLSGAHPPYTLYRFSIRPAMDPSGGTNIAPGTHSITGSPDSPGKLLFTPLASNIRDMTFTYFDADGNVKDPTAWTASSGTVDVSGNETQAARAVRSGRTAHEANALHGIKVEMTGMVGTPDKNYWDPKDSLFPHYRKYYLSSTVNLKDLGVIPRRVGKEGDPGIPNPPTNLQVVTGHCDGMILTWDPPADLSNVDRYTVRLTDGTLVKTVSGASSAFTYIDNPSIGTNYYVYSQNYKHESSTPAGPVAGAVSDDGVHTPLQATNLEAVQGVEGIDVTWIEPSGDNPQVAGDPQVPPPLRDLQGYRLYRDLYDAAGDGNDFTPSPALLIADETTPPPVIGPNDTLYRDTTACPCELFTYKIEPINKCSRSGPASDPMTGTGVQAPLPTGEAPGAVSTLMPASVTQAGLDYTIQLQWDRIHQTQPSSLPTAVRYYEIYMDSAPGATTLLQTADDTDWNNPAPFIADIGTIHIPAGEYRYFRVRPYWNCGTKIYGDYSNEISIPCIPTWTADFTNPATDGAAVSYLVNLQVTLTNPDAVPINAVVIAVTSDADGTTIFGPAPATDTAPDVWEKAWDTTPLPAGWYTIHGYIQDANGCSAAITRHVQVTQECLIIVTPIGLTSPDTVGVELRAPIDGNEYFLDTMTLSWNANYQITNINAQDQANVWTLYTSPGTFPDLVLTDFLNTNFADAGFYNLSAGIPDGNGYAVTTLMITFNQPVDVANGTLNLNFPVDGLEIKRNVVPGVGGCANGITTTETFSLRVSGSHALALSQELCCGTESVVPQCGSPADYTPFNCEDGAPGLATYNGPWATNHKCTVDVTYVYPNPITSPATWDNAYTCSTSLIPLFLGPF